MRIAIDAMGGDNAPLAVLEGCRAALLELPETVELHLFGDAAAVEPFLATLGGAAKRVSFTATTETIGCDEQPTLAIRKKKDSSMVRALESVAKGETACIVSAGSTGALLTGATLLVRRQKGVKRPALAVELPTAAGNSTLLIDCGANADSKPGYLQQFAVMGAAYMEHVAGVAEPRVGLLSNGAEAEKGNELTKAAHALLLETPVRFTGNCEARDVLSGDFDVVVCDGFDGNAVLKSTEGAAKLITDILKTEMQKSVLTMAGAALAKPAFRALKRRMDYKEYGGAPLLGVAGGIIKAHGSSDARAIRSAILQAQRLLTGDVVRIVGERIASLPETAEG